MFCAFLAIHSTPGPVVQSVVSQTAEPGIASSILASPFTFVEIDHEIISTFILLLSYCQLQAKVHKVLVNP